MAALLAMPAAADADEAMGRGQNGGRTSFASGGSLEAPPLTQKWSVDLGGTVSAPAIGEGLAYAVSLDRACSYDCSAVPARLSAFDLADGSVRWWRPVAPGAQFAYQGGRLYIVEGRTISALSASSGATAWSMQLTSTLSVPVAGGGKVYVNQGSGTLLALDSATGATLWSKSTGLQSPPVIDEKNVYMTRDYYCDPQAFDRETGRRVWRNTQDCSNSDDLIADGARVMVRGTPGLVVDSASGGVKDTTAATKQMAAAGSTGVAFNNGSLQARNLQSGVGVWNFTGDGKLATPPLVVNNTVYAGSSGGNLYAVDLTTGAQTWTVSTGANTTPGANGMAAAQGVLAVPTGSKLTAWSRAALTPTPGLDLAITEGPGGPTGSRDATFAFASTSLAPMRCRLDRGAWSPCPGSAAYTGLADGPHTFEVESRDAGGNETVALASREFSVDTKPPTVTFTGGPSGRSNSTSASFNYVVDDGAIECRLDTEDWKACESGWSSYSGLTQGDHSFDIRATDGQNNVTVAKRAFTVDTVGPATTITSGPPSPTYRDDATLSFEASEPGSKFECLLGTDVYWGTWVPCASPTTFSGLSEGSQTIQVRAIDSVGNRGNPDKRTFVVDAKDPETTILQGPPPLTRSRTVQIDYSASEPAMFECQLDGAAWVQCGGYWASLSTTGSQIYQGLADGSHTVQIRARDSANSFDPTPASVTFEVRADATRAQLALSQPTARSVTARFASTDSGMTYECALDDEDSMSPCTSPTTFEALGTGSHTFRLQTTSSTGDVELLTRDFVVAAPSTDGPSTGGSSKPPSASTPAGAAPAPQGASFPQPSYVPALVPSAKAAVPALVYSTLRGSARTWSSYARTPNGARLLRAGSLAFSYRSARKGTLVARVLTGGKPMVVAQAKPLTFATGQAKTVKLRLTRAGARLLRAGGRSRLTMDLRFTPTGGKPAGARETFRLAGR